MLSSPDLPPVPLSLQPLPAAPAPLRAPATPTAPAADADPAAREAALRGAAQAFEAVFLAEMLKAAGFGTPRATFGGGAGEEAFSSLLVREQADRLAAAGGIGLAEQIFRALMAREAETAA